MNVGMICPYDWSHPGGVRTHIIGLAAAMNRAGVGVEIIAPATSFEKGIFTVGGSVGIPSNGSIARICFSKRAGRRVSERIREIGVDVLHLHEPLIPSVSLLALMKSSRMPSVATFHAAADRSVGYALARPLLARYLEKISVKIVVSEAARAFIGRYFPAEYQLIPNGVDVARFAGAEPDAQVASLRPCVLFLGRPEPRKGFDAAVEAVRLVRKRLDLRLVTVGAAPRIKENWIVSLGVIDDDRVPRVFSAADVFCAPSAGAESFGIVLLEAMAAGTPVVASDIPGYREAAGDAALLVTPTDAHALAEGLRKVLTEESFALSLKELGKARARALDWNLIAGSVISAYEEALRGGNHRRREVL